jgi:hypothetical protein
MSLAPFNQEIARRLTALDEAVSAGGVLNIAYASPMGGQPERINMSCKLPGRAAISFAFTIDVATRIATIAELFNDEATADLIFAETAKASA